MGKKEKTVAGKKGESGGGGEDSKRDQKLQAILLADSFSKCFRPITWEKPKVLLPLVNVPMIEYTIEFLAQNGVEEVITNLASCELRIEMQLEGEIYIAFDRYRHKYHMLVAFLLLSLYFNISAAVCFLRLACGDVTGVLVAFKVVIDTLSQMHHLYSMFICW